MGKIIAEGGVIEENSIIKENKCSIVKENKYYSYNLGLLPKGCQFCVKGEKLVVFLTGLCPRRCYFCPVSDDKFLKDVSFANERRINSADDNSVNDNTFTNEHSADGLIKEAALMKARGAGITGGDPLMKLERTIGFIEKLKKEFGREFHIHLYTSLNLVNLECLKKLHEAGLDEIRFHLDLDSEKLWGRLKLARKFDWDIGVEIPVIPGKDIKKLIDFICDKVDFLNLNELEVADNKQNELLQKGFKVKDELSYAVEGSLEYGLELMEYVKKKYAPEKEYPLKYPLKVHLCTAKLKDAVQLTERIKRESEGAARKFDVINEEGLLARGALYLPELKPDFGYRERLKQACKLDYIIRLRPLLSKIKKKFNLKDDEIYLDEEKPRILLSKKLAQKKKNYFLNLGLIPAVVVEYPTADQLEIEVEFV